MKVESIISKDRICFLNQPCSKQEVIEHLADMFVKDQSVKDKEAFIKAIYAREEEYNTYIGNETAIPHAICEVVQQAGIAFLKSEEPFAYGDEDEQVRFVFMLAIPQHSDAQHLKMLSVLATQLMHQTFRDELLHARNEEDIYQVLQGVH